MNDKKIQLLVFSILLIIVSCNSGNIRNGSCQNDYTGNELAALNTQIAQGWNTWDTRSVLTHVLLPEGFALHLKLKDNQSGEILEDALIGRGTYGYKEHVTPGPHAYDGSYTELEVEWQDIHIRVQSAAERNELYLLISPIKATPGDSLIIVPQMLWEREGDISIDHNLLTGQSPTRTTKVHVKGDRWVTGSEIIKAPLDQEIAITSDDSKSSEEVKSAIARAKAGLENERSKFNRTPELYNAMQTVLAWDLIFEPTHDRVIAPVSRTWNVGWEGWILFDWDTYFAAYMFSLDNREHAYANAIAITKEITESGFIPNFGSARCTSEDRSQPPVGSFVVKEIYRKYQEKWFLHEVFDELLSWNRWWVENRDVAGYLCWGSDPYEHGELPDWLERGIGAKKGAKWESGLDNSPMYDDAVFDTTLHRLMQADVGLMSFYILDCRSLSEIATVLGKTEIAEELADRAETYSEKLETLWNEEVGLYLNKDLVTGEFSYSLSPTLFYPLLAKVPSQEQAERMMHEHFYNPEEFWGEYIMPSIARNDLAYKDNIYWRGRIWAPMNFLVYLGLRNYDLPEAEREMVEKSKNLLLQSWTEERHVYENYSAETGRGDNAGMSDKFYHWGALLGFIGIMDEGYVPSPQLPIQDLK
jgi:putative isomerase